MEDIPAALVGDPGPGYYMYRGRLPMSEMLNPPDMLDRVGQFRMLPDDVIVGGYPKSGTTWLQEIVWLVMNDVDIESANEKSVWHRVILLELKEPDQSEPVDVISHLHAPRLYKTHMPFWFFEEQLTSTKPKVVQIMRNPKDVVVSYFQFMKLLSYEGTFADYFKLFQNNLCPLGDWFEHVRGWWQHKEDGNVLIIFYEDMLVDLSGCIKRIADFLGKSLADHDLDKIVNRTRFEQMKTNPATNLSTLSWIDVNKVPFIRKGVVGDWRSVFTQEQSDWVDEQCLKRFGDIGIEFTFV